MPKPLRILLAEDRATDAELVLRALRRSGYEPTAQVVDTEEDFLAGLKPGLDLVLSDYEMPQFGGLRALELLQQSGLEVPLIIVSGMIGEDTAVAVMKEGAADYLLKDRLGRLGAAVGHALEQAQSRRERTLVNEGLKLANEKYRALAARIEAIREQERTKIAREIHDVLAQELTRLKIDLVWLGKRLGKPFDEPLRSQLIERIADATTQTDTAISTVQRIATELRPVVLDSLGLPAAVEWQTEDFARRTGLACTATTPRGEFALDRERATALFRILQESLTNIARHARAGRVSVELASDANELVLTIQDDGVGIGRIQAEDPGSIGLVGMRERAEAFGGALTIAGTPGAGTRVTVRLPRSILPPA
jgi:signal transduction histidine kinase